MASFPLCPRCRKEYTDPADRRFHAEPNACPDCGPHLEFLDAQGTPCVTADPVEEAFKILSSGRILALKGLGGVHLACDAINDEAVRRLRTRKFREEKPLAVMVQDSAAAASFVVLSEPERMRLPSPERPIVIARQKSGVPLAPSVAPGMNTLGIMLPYTPLHHLLLAGPFKALVMTSGNRTDEPIAIENGEAVTRLAGIADRFLLHNRDILVRCDDSIVMEMAGRTVMVSRSRGFAPRAVELRKDFPPVLALGGHMKTTICVTKDRYAFFSPHIGDMDTPQARDFHRESIALMEKITRCTPRIIACDCHPGYYTSRMAHEMKDVAVVEVQHHHAHIVSCMAERGLTGQVIGLAMDGTGYGTDGHVWGGEFLCADERNFTRLGHFTHLPLPGGEAAVREPWRCAASLLKHAFGNVWSAVAKQLNPSLPENALLMIDRMMTEAIQCPLTSSLGRLFEGIAALIGLRQKASFEGQAPMELEALAERGNPRPLPFATAVEGDITIIDIAPAIRELVAKRTEGCEPADLAASFLQMAVEIFLALSREIRHKTGLNRVVLSGGCFQNRNLVERTVSVLEKSGFDVYTHSLVPPNDGGLALGQAVVAAAKAEQ